MSPSVTSPLACELIIHSAKSPSPPTLLADQSLSLPDGYRQALIVITDEAESPQSVLSTIRTACINEVSIIQIPGGPELLDATQISHIFEEEIRAYLKSASHALFVANADTLPVEILSRLAASFEGAACGVCRRIQIDNQFVATTTRAVYGGRLIAEQRLENTRYFALLRSTSAQATSKSTLDCGLVTPTVRVHPVAQIPPTPLTITKDPQENTIAGLSGASLIISGGRGVKTPENFELLAQVADHLGAAVGASLPAVDMGLAPATRQVGQSGNYVKPHTYIAVGISGTPQHLAGIDPVTRIVAINSDDQAPIFGVSEVGVIAECETFLPALLRQLELRASS